MELEKLIFPIKGDYYLKNIFEKKEENIFIQCGSVTLTKGEILPFKKLDSHEITYLISGKLEVHTEEEGLKIMNQGDLIYLNKDEIRKTVTVEDSEILFFLVKNEKDE